VRYHIAALQVAVHDRENPAERLERVTQWIKHLQDVSLVVLPELWITSFFANNFTEVAEPIDGPIAQALAAIAKHKNIHLHAGSFVERDGDNLYNTSLFFAPDGTLLTRYRKRHLFGYGSEESRLLTHGEPPTVVTTSLGKIGFGICYDVRFPEHFRAQLNQGAEIFLLNAAWPYARLEHWQTLTQARAIENLSYFIACNSVGISNGHQQLGHSVIYDPWGAPLAQAWDNEATLCATIDLEHLATVRNHFPALLDRDFLRTKVIPPSAIPAISSD
jgi:predicted amidohydrolase